MNKGGTSTRKPRGARQPSAVGKAIAAAAAEANRMAAVDAAAGPAPPPRQPAMATAGALPYNQSPRNIATMRRVHLASAQRVMAGVERGVKKSRLIVARTQHRSKAITKTLETLRAARKAWARCLKDQEVTPEEGAEAVGAFVAAIFQTARDDATATRDIAQISRSVEALTSEFRVNKYQTLSLMRGMGNVSTAMLTQPTPSFLSRRSLTATDDDAVIPADQAYAEMTIDWDLFGAGGDVPLQEEGRGEDDDKVRDAMDEEEELPEAGKQLFTKKDSAFLKDARAKLARKGFEGLDAEERKRIYKYYKRYSDVAAAQHKYLAEQEAELEKHEQQMIAFGQNTAAELRRLDAATPYKFRIDITTST